MAKLKTDSPLSRRIVRAFLDFLDSVEPAPGVDLEGLEVARECLSEVFKVNAASVNDGGEPDDLLEIFRSLEQNERCSANSDLSQRGASTGVPSSSSSPNIINGNSSEASKSQGETTTREPQSTGVSKEDLLGQFFAALEKIHFFPTTLDENAEVAELERATRLFQDALEEMERSGCHAYDQRTLAETLKCQGNKLMQSKRYSDAIELYTIAIALCEKNAVYYCNRAAAYTQTHKYDEAIRDCHKSIEVDPNYSKAYSRLGLAYYAQGNYSDAIEKGFKKALQLDPNNEHVKENIRVAEQKLKEEQQWREQNQNTRSGYDNQGAENQSRSHGVPPPFTMPFNMNSLPTDFANMFMNMAGSQGQSSGSDNVDQSEEPGIRLGGNINFNLGEQMPEDLTGALRSMMQMFSGPSTENTQDPASGR